MEKPRVIVLGPMEWVPMANPRKAPIFSRAQKLPFDPEEGYEWPGDEPQHADSKQPDSK